MKQDCIISLVLSVVVAALSACSGSDGNHAATAGTAPAVEVSACDTTSEAYTLGQQAARAMLSSSPSREQLHEHLLDARAVISLLQRRHGDQVAADYQAGFTDAIRACGDTLAAAIL